MVFKINGVDITPYIAYQGLQWQRGDVDSPEAGRALDGIMYRDRVSTKIRWDVTCRPMTAAEARIVLNLIAPEYITVECDDPMYGRVTFEAYSNNNPATFLLQRQDGTEWWTGITFPIIER